MRSESRTAGRESKGADGFRTVAKLSIVPRRSEGHSRAPALALVVVQRAEDEVDASIQSLTSIIEPILMIGVGIMVGTIVIAMYLPMFKLLTLIE